MTSDRRVLRQSIIWWLCWSGLATVGLILADWQWGRAEFKQAGNRNLQQQVLVSPSSEPANYQRITLTGRWLIEETRWWDNRIYQSQVGLAAITPLVDEHGRVWLVNRGFAHTQGKRDFIPLSISWNDSDIVEGAITTLTGVWQSIAETPLTLGDNQESNRVQQVIPGEWWERLGSTHHSLVGFNGMVHQTAGDNLLTPWWQSQAAEMPPERHIGYAIQWLLLSITCFCIAWLRRPSASEIR